MSQAQQVVLVLLVVAALGQVAFVWRRAPAFARKRLVTMSRQYELRLDPETESLLMPSLVRSVRWQIVGVAAFFVFFLLFTGLVEHHPLLLTSVLVLLQFLIGHVVGTIASAFRNFTAVPGPVRTASPARRALTDFVTPAHRALLIWSPLACTGGLALALAAQLAGPGQAGVTIVATTIATLATGVTAVVAAWIVRCPMPSASQHDLDWHHSILVDTLRSLTLTGLIAAGAGGLGASAVLSAHSALPGWLVTVAVAYGIACLALVVTSVVVPRRARHSATSQQSRSVTA